MPAERPYKHAGGSGTILIGEIIVPAVAPGGFAAAQGAAGSFPGAGIPPMSAEIKGRGAVLSSPGLIPGIETSCRRRQAARLGCRDKPGNDKS
ncbi:hypothetical protein J3R73_005215 [Labrys monachus]|uniref:Uncharacterized protein n=1 Tax=Labrys monachus TaxID=217067 RepID=A0ABU0FLE0_9HYPH|nr:hypothetical protein [Labrys monachus]